MTVTAERRVENVQNVPSSISVLSSDLLEALNTGGQDLRMLSGRVPSLNIESSFGRAFPRFYIRGYGNTDFRLNASQPVSLVYDDVVQENPILKGFPAFDLDRIEVLRGPQGTLFGRNTPAGVVKFESTRPSVKKMEGYASLSYGSFNTVNAEAAVNLPLSSDMALRVCGLSQTRSDWVDNTFAAGPTKALEGYRDNALRVQLLYEPGKYFSALGNVHVRDYKGSARLFRANIIQPGSNDFVPGFDATKVSFDGKNQSELQNYGANLRLRWALSNGLALHSITGYEAVRTYSRGDARPTTPARCLVPSPTTSARSCSCAAACATPRTRNSSTSRTTATRALRRASGRPSGSNRNQCDAPTPTCSQPKARAVACRHRPRTTNSAGT